MQQQNRRRALKQLDSQDVAGAHEDHAPRGRPKSSGGGQGSRAWRLHKFQEASTVWVATRPGHDADASREPARSYGRSRPGHTDPDEFDIVGDSDDSDNYD